MRFGVLGPLAVWTEDGAPVPVPEAKVRALLADLLTAEGRPVSADRLIEDLWRERLPRDPTAALQTRVSQLRRTLGDAEPGGRDLVVRQPPGYRLAVPADAVDAGRFRALAARARATGDAWERAALLADALALWRGPAYADFADLEFAGPAAARLEEERLTAVEEHARARLDLGEHHTLAAELGDLVSRYPLREGLRAVQLRALYQSGRQGEALAAHAELRALLADQLGVDPGPELTALHAAMLRQDPGLRPTAPARPPTNLPAVLTPLIGREEAVADVRALLAAHRLVTLTGPGGVGKTRLALAAARAAGGAFVDGVWSVELAGLDRATATPAAVADLVASVLGVRDEVSAAAPGDPVDRLAGALAPRHLLLLLDNCEHVVAPVAAVAEALLRAAPGLRVLTAGQEPLAIPGERLRPVPPLPAPGPEAPLEELESFGAVRLFAERAAAAAPGFRLGPENAAAVSAICRRLDGLPLALELAAIRVRALGVAELAARLDDRFAVLATGRRGGPARQQTLRAMIDWSWEPLSPFERAVLRRLAVHADGCTLAAGEATAGDEPAAGGDFLEALSRLVDRSLVVATDGPEGPRYTLLESVRAYGLDRLREAGELDHVQRRHVAHYTALAERAEPHLRGPGQRRWLRTLDRERANLRAALETAVRLRDGRHAARLVTALAWYWHLRGRLAEAVRSFDLALEATDDAEVAAWRAGLALLASDGTDAAARTAATAPDGIADPAALARAQWFLAYAHRRFTDLTATTGLLGAALDGFRAVDDRWGVAAALAVRASVDRALGALDDAERDARDSQALFEELGDAWGRLKAATTLAEIAEIRGDHAEAERLNRHGLRLAEELELWDEVSLRLSGLGRIALLTGDFATADALHARAARTAAAQSQRVAEHFAEMGLALSARRRGRHAEVAARLTGWLPWLRRARGEPGLPLVLAELGFAAEQGGDAEAALRLHREGLAAAREFGDPRAVALAMEGLAGAHALAGAPAHAARLLGAAAALRAGAGAPLPPAERHDVDRITTTLRATLGDRTFTTEFTHGTHHDPATPDP
ncbi:BTAD domain-containing putative transcriptional regulator [Streptomyces mayteni]